MSTRVEINGVSFLPLKDAAKAFSYSRDYVARLAREGKIVATQVNRQWLVDSVSLQNFAEASELEQGVRKQQLSLERKREQVVKQQVKNIKNELRIKRRGINLHAQMVAACVLCLGLFAGASVYTTSALLSSPVTSVANLSVVSTSEEVASVEVEPLLVATPQETTLYSSEVEYPVFIVEEETRALTVGNSEGILLLDRSGEMQSSVDVQTLFSDDVEVKYTEDNTGVVIYRDETGAVVEYPFVSVPTGSVKHTAAHSSTPLEVI